MHTERQITETSKTVDEGIALLVHAGTAAAATFMLERGARLAVIGRVLARDARRRAPNRPLD